MKKLGLLALSLLLAACDNQGNLKSFPTGSVFKATAGGEGLNASYSDVYEPNEKNPSGINYEIKSQPIITITNPAGSLGARIDKIEVAFFNNEQELLNFQFKKTDKDNNNIDSTLKNPHTFSFPFELAGGWACSQGQDNGIEQDPANCLERVPYTRTTTLLGYNQPVTGSNNSIIRVPAIVPSDLANVLMTHVKYKASFGGYMTITFHGFDKTRKPIKFTSDPIPYNIVKGQDIKKK